MMPIPFNTWQDYLKFFTDVFTKSLFQELLFEQVVGPFDLPGIGLRMPVLVHTFCTSTPDKR